MMARKRDMIRKKASCPIILGAGVAGLVAGNRTAFEIYEANSYPGGTCTTYYMGLSGEKSYYRNNENTYRFERGGGHWIFGSDSKVLEFVNLFSPVRSYTRASAVYFPNEDMYVPYPIQNHLSYLPQDVKKRILSEILQGRTSNIHTLADWLESSFGKTLCRLFFFPFHELYTAGLFTKVSPQDEFKSPVDNELIVRGAADKTPMVGYNSTFVYPVDGLDCFVRKLTESCEVNFNKKAVRLDLKHKEVQFTDGSSRNYEFLVSTIPLNTVLEMVEEQGSRGQPFTSVLVVNIGARRGGKCPAKHWLYVPYSKAGFYRVGFYSNIDNSFIPKLSRESNNRVGIYVEKAYRGGERPSSSAVEKVCSDVVAELKEWGFIEEPEIIDPTWIEVAYTWQFPRSKWRDESISFLKENGIYQIGRYGKWKFQGISESIKDGLGVPEV